MNFENGCSPPLKDEVSIGLLNIFQTVYNLLIHHLCLMSGSDMIETKISL